VVSSTIMKQRAVFLDRDGVINKLLYFEDIGRIDTPLRPDQFELYPNVGEAINSIKSLGYLVIVISNQPNVGKGILSKNNFEAIRHKMHNELAKSGAILDDEYYCFHHPSAERIEYRMKCSCRKPEPGMIKKAAYKHQISLRESYMIGDDISDVQAGAAAGCDAIFVGHYSSLLGEMFRTRKVYPEFVARDLMDAARWIQRRSKVKAISELGLRVFYSKMLSRKRVTNEP